MTRARIAAGVFGAVLILLALAIGYRILERRAARPAAALPAMDPSPVLTPAAAGGESPRGFLYGRVTTHVGASYEGRLRWGRGEEAFWGDYFNGSKKENPWVAHVPPERRPKERRPIQIFGIKLAGRERPVDLRRLFMARFGDIGRIEALGRDVRVTLKSGTALDLDRLAASDFDDGVRVWVGSRGPVDLDSTLIRSIELLPAPEPGDAPRRLHGAVRTRQGDFTGYLQWNREKGVGDDELDGRGAGGEPLRLRFDAIRSIARRSADSSLVTRLDGREIVLSGTAEAGRGNRGVYVDDRRYGRVLISWDAFERVDFSPGGSGPAYGDFAPGRPLTGSVQTRGDPARSGGGSLAGRLVYDLDESETTETLDAPSQGVDYTVPFGLIASIVLPGREEPARVTLQSREELRLERSGDLGERNAGILVFVEGRQRPEYVPWVDVERIDLDRQPATAPADAGRPAKPSE